MAGRISVGLIKHLLQLIIYFKSQCNVDIKKRQQLLPIVVGTAALVLGGLLNEFFLAILFSSKPEISYGAKFIIRTFNAACLILGLWLIICRNRIYTVNFLKSLITVFIPLILLYLILEISFKFFIPYFPLSLQTYVEEPFRVICQSSKAEAVPRNHIAILGDSYAMGAGDWYLNSDPRTNPPYSSSHLIQEALNRDVVSFGKSGASSVTGLIDHPNLSLRKLKERFDIGDPEVILVYFYEGNDLSDNLRDLNFREPSYFDYSSLDTLNYTKFSDYMVNKVIKKSNLESIKTRIIGLRFLKDIVVSYLRKHSTNLDEDNNFESQSNHNMIKFRDKKIQLPARLQSPCLELTQDELSIGLELFKYSLNFLSDHLPESQIHVIYVPSVLSCYEVVGSVSVQAVKGRDEFILSLNFAKGVIISLVKLLKPV